MAYTAEQIATPTADNRYVVYPYTKLMNAFPTVDQAAAVILTTVDHARQLGARRGLLLSVYVCGQPRAAVDSSRYESQGFRKICGCTPWAAPTLWMWTTSSTASDWTNRPPCASTRRELISGDGRRSPGADRPQRAATRRCHGSAARLALDQANVTIDQVTFMDIYSCFPSAVQVRPQRCVLSRGISATNLAAACPAACFCLRRRLPLKKSASRRPIRAN